LSLAIAFGSSLLSTHNKGVLDSLDAVASRLHGVEVKLSSTVKRAGIPQGTV
jgi:hypothetical protein